RGPLCRGGAPRGRARLRGGRALLDARGQRDDQPRDRADGRAPVQDVPRLRTTNLTTAQRRGIRSTGTRCRLWHGTRLAQLPPRGRGQLAMRLGRMWRRVRSLSERPHHLLAISDLHLGCDLRPGNRLERPRPTDAPLASFLDYHATHREGGKPWRLILNGDIVDFVAITLVPKEVVPFEISPEERSLGLAPTEPKCVWKLRRTAERHPAVFDALARFIQKGNSVHIIRGNHDSEWRWP